jgi:hypothetical protein
MPASELISKSWTVQFIGWQEVPHRTRPFQLHGTLDHEKTPQLDANCGVFCSSDQHFFKHLASAANLPLQIRSAGQSVSLAPPSMPC